MKKNALNKSESKIQQEIVMYYRNAFCLKHHSHRCMIFSIPNEGRAQASAGLIATGLYPGCADLCVIKDGFGLPPFKVNDIASRVLFIEVKTPTGIQSPKQKTFHEHCQQMGIPYHIVRSLEDFKRVIESI